MGLKTVRRGRRGIEDMYLLKRDVFTKNKLGPWPWVSYDGDICSSIQDAFAQHAVPTDQWDWEIETVRL